MKRILVTGATGFLGAHVVRQLIARGMEPIPVARTGSDRWRLASIGDLQWATLDLLSTKAIHGALAQGQPDAIIHCAAYGVDYHQQDPQEAMQANILGTATLVEAAARTGVQAFVHVGTCFEYGDQAGAISETASLMPVGVYGATKAAGTLMALERAKTLGLNLCVVRPFGMYGPLEGDHKLVPLIRKACKERESLPLTSGEQVRDYVYVGDVAEAIATLVETPKFPAGEVFNLASGRAVSLREFVTACARVFGGEDLLRFGKLAYRPNEMWSLVAETSKWERYWGRPLARTSLEEGLRVMYEREVMV